MARIGLLVTKLNGGGAERTVANLSNIFAEYGHTVDIIVFDGQNITYPYSGKLIDLKLGTNKNKFDAIIKNLKRVMCIRKIKKEHKLDVMISFLDTPNLLNVLSGVKKCKKIVSIRNNLSSEKQNKLRRFLIKFSCTKANLTISISNSVKKDLVDNFGVESKKIRTIYNPIDVKKLLNSEEEFNDFSIDFRDYYNIVTMGRITYQKGQWHLIKVINNLVKEYKNIRLYILGEGELEEELNQLVKNYGLENHIIFLGYLKNSHKFMKECDLFVFPSLFEGLGNVLLEAMALGLPVISTDCKSGPREIIAPNTDIENLIVNFEDEEYGVLTPPFNNDYDLYNKKLSHEEDEMYKAIENFILNNDLRTKYSLKSIARANDFSKEKIYDDWINILNIKS